MSNQTFCTFAAPSKWYTFRLQSGILFDYYLQAIYCAIFSQYQEFAQFRIEQVGDGGAGRLEVAPKSVYIGCVLIVGVRLKQLYFSVLGELAKVCTPTKKAPF